MTIQTTDNKYGVAKWIVDPVLGRGTHTTITSAIADAISGDSIFIRGGTYTENFTLKAGVSLASFTGNEDTPNVIIQGKLSFSSAGTVTLGNIRLETNGDYFLEVTGSAASIVNLYSCTLACMGNDGINCTSSSSSARIRCFECTSFFQNATEKFFTDTSTGDILFFGSRLGATSTNSTKSAGRLNFEFCTCFFPVTTSGTNQLGISNSNFDTGSTFNATCLTVGGSGSSFVFNSRFASGTASAISISSTLNISTSSIHSTNTNAITGSGTLVYSGLSFSNTSSLINTSTLTGRSLNTGSISFDGGTNLLSNYTEGIFTPTLVGATTAGVTTYTVQQGYYTRIGNLVTCFGFIQITGATGTGNARIDGLPFTIKNQTNGNPVGPISIAAATWAWPAGLTAPVIRGTINTTNAVIQISGSSTAANFLQMTNAGASFIFTLTYQI